MSDRALEAAHEPGPEPRWVETWYVDFADDDGRGGFLQLALHPHHRRAWVWACLVRPGELIVVRDHDVPLPRPGSLEVRASGLWTDLTCETPLSHWTFGLEAFAVRLDDPTDAYEGERGDRVPLGFDLEWEALAPPFEYPGAAARPGAGHVQHPGRVHGEVLLGDETLAFEGTGERDHAWGARDWWGTGWHWSAAHFDDGGSLSVARPDRAGPEHATGYLMAAGEDPHPIVRAEVQTETDADGIPVSARYVVEDELEVEVAVVAPAPLMLPDPASDHVSRLARALCRFRTADATGLGWAEWLNP